MEAAFVIPVLFTLLLLLLQPGIVLYDRMVMQGAAAEGCRLLATRTDVAGAGEEAYRNAVLRRLGSVPQEDHFHVHGGGSCTWEIVLDGDEHADTVSVSISNKLKPLPLVDFGATLLGLVDESGYLSVQVTAESSTQPAWAASGEQGLDPSAWVEDGR